MDNPYLQSIIHIHFMEITKAVLSVTFKEIFCLSGLMKKIIS